MYRSSSFGSVTPGSVGIGAGGRYTSYSFDPVSGLSNDSRLVPFLQFLTPAQLQDALDGGEYVTHDLTSLLIDDVTGTGSFWLAPNETGAAADQKKPASDVPLWAWLVGGGLLTLLLLKR